MYKYCCCIFFFVFGASPIVAQYSPLQDSLQRSIRIEDDRHKKLLNYLELIEDLYSTGKYKEGRLFLQELEHYLAAQNFPLGMGGLSLAKSVESYYQENDLKQTLGFCLDGIQMIKLARDTHKVAQQIQVLALSRAGEIFQDAGLIDKALSYYHEAMDSSTVHHFLFGQGVSYNNIGVLYNDHLNAPHQAIQYLEKGLAIAQQIGDQYALAALYANLASLYIETSQFEQAEHHLNQAITLNTKLEEPAELSYNYWVKSKLHFQLQQYEAARIFTQKMDSTSAPNKWDFYKYLSLGMISHAEGKLLEAAQYLQVAQQYSAAHPYLLIKEETFILMAEIAKDRGEFLQSTHYYSEANVIRDSIEQNRQIDKLIQLETQFNLRKVEKEKEQLKQEKALQLTTISYQRWQLGLISVIAILFFVGGLLLFRQKQHLLKSYQLLVVKNRSLTQQQVKRKEESEKNVKKQVAPSTELIGRIIDELEKEKVYLQLDLTLSSFAKSLESNTSYVSKAINNKYQKNFNSFINEYRVREVLQYFEEGQQDAFTLLALAQKAGFKSKSVFNKAFKDYTGVTPTFYLDNMKRS